MRMPTRLNFSREQFSLPGLKRLRSYRSAWLRGDIIAGITVAAYLVPQCLAYAELAGVQPIAGLWAILPPMLIYALLGSSPQLSVGPESTTAVMTAAAIMPLVAGDSSNYASLCSLLALLVGSVCCLAAFAQLGFLADLLSKPILVGYMAGVAVIMIVGQLGKISGMSLKAESLFGQIGEFSRHLSEIHPPTLILAAGVLIFLLVVQRRFPNAPGPLLAVLLATSAVYLFSDNVLTARAFGAKNNYRIDGNQELLALGALNIGNGIMQGFPVSSSGSRTAIGDSLGSRSQLFSLVAFLIVILVLLFLRPLLSLFPKAALGAIVIYAALRLIEISEFNRLRCFKTSEFRLALVTMFGVLATDILVGVGVAVGLSVVDLFARLMRPHDAVLGEVPNLAGLHDIEDWQGATTIPGLVLYRYDAPLCFANAENFRKRVIAAIEAEKVPVEWFVLNAEAILDIDITAVDMLKELHRELIGRGITFAMARVKQDLYQQLKKGDLSETISTERIYPTLEEAIEAFHRKFWV